VLAGEELEGACSLSILDKGTPAARPGRKATGRLRREPYPAAGLPKG